MRHGSQLLLGWCGPLVWLAGSAFPVLAGANRLLADPVAVCVGDLQPFHGWPAYQTLEAVPDPEEYSPPQVLVDTDTYLEQNRKRTLDDGFMHAVFNPSFNALATAMATARHRASRCWRSPAIATLSRR